MSLFVHLKTKIESKNLIALSDKPSICFSKTFLLIRILMQFTTGQSIKRILIFEDEKCNEMQLMKNFLITYIQCCLMNEKLESK